MSTTEQQQKAPQDIRNVVNFLRSSKAGLKNRVGVLNGKRVDYFKGKSAVKALLSPAYAKTKSTPKITSETEAHALLHNIIPFAFFLRVDRGQPVGSASSPKTVQINQMQLFKPEEYYAWFYEGSQWTNYVGGVAMVAVILAGVMFPLWPPILRLGVWYLSMILLGLIGLLLVISVIRLIFYIITIIVASPGIWIFPRLFADVGFIDSFIPLWEWDLPKKKSKKKKSAEKSEKAKSSGITTPNGAVLEVDESGISTTNSRPASRTATVEEVPDENS
ncbi:translocation protein [Multifurca ochricompacta]|uniref:Translocation protein SEC62 n=1 Tax=Multifurca ochricompacta TaxID=376703 RepID=A0AAD4QJU8_9AGAM|nr:translocation protein [Multifurca ochricompacta]